jgi:hypothetical protein
MSKRGEAAAQNNRQVTPQSPLHPVFNLDNAKADFRIAEALRSVLYQILLN